MYNFDICGFNSVKNHDYYKRKLISFMIKVQNSAQLIFSLQFFFTALKCK